SSLRTLVLSAGEAPVPWSRSSGITRERNVAAAFAISISGPSGARNIGGPHDFALPLPGPCRSLPVAGQRVDVEESRHELDVEVEARTRTRFDSADRRPIVRDVLDAHEGHVRALQVDGLVGPRVDAGRHVGHDLKRIEQLALPAELAIPAALERERVDVELQL